MYPTDHAAAGALAELPPQTRYDGDAFKFVVVIASGLDPVAALDATAHSLLALGAAVGPDVLGRRHTDASGESHAPLARYPVVILSARPGRIGKLLSASAEYVDVISVDYPNEGQTTTHDEDYGAALSRRRADELVYRAAALYGPRKTLDTLCGHFTLHRPVSA